MLETEDKIRMYELVLLSRETEIVRLQNELKRKQTEIDYLKNSYLRLDTTSQTNSCTLNLVTSPTLQLTTETDLMERLLLEEDTRKRLEVANAQLRKKCACLHADLIKATDTLSSTLATVLQYK